MITTLTTGFRFARRELRSGLQGFWIFFTCLFLGVAAIAIIGTLSVSIQKGLSEQGQPLLGGDMEFSLIHRKLNKPELEFVSGLGKVSHAATMRSIAISTVKPEGKPALRTLVEVKAIDGAYPLYGTLDLANGKTHEFSNLSGNGTTFNAYAEQSVLTRLKLKLGDHIELGKAIFAIKEIIAREPDRIGGGFAIGPRLMISHAGLKATGLVKPGSLVRWRYRVKLADQKTDIKLLTKIANDDFPTSGWRIKSRAMAAPGTQKFITRLAFFLSLTGLTALVVGGAGVANAVSTFLTRRKKNIATLKCLGASSQVILATYLIEVLIIAALAIATGLVVGAILPLVAMPMLHDLLPVPISPTVEFVPLFQAGLFGFLVTIAFSLWPLARARETPASELFRGNIDSSFKWPQFRFLALIGLAIAAIIGLTLYTSPALNVTAIYIAAVAASFAMLTGLAHLIMWIARHVSKPRRAVSRLAISNLYRPGAPTPSIVLALGLGLTLFVTLALVDNNVSRELKNAVPDYAPSFFFIDVQNTEVEAFTAFAKKQTGVEEVRAAPMLRGRIQKLNGKPLKQVHISPEVSWAYRGDRGLTYAASLPDGSRLTKGKWWPKDYDGPPLVSIVDNIASGGGLDIGDTITVNILGRNVTAKVANLRAVDWQSLRMNFALVFSPGTLKGAPHTFLVTVAMDDKYEDDLLAAVSDKYRAITAIRIKDALDTVNNLLGQMLLAIRVASSITMITGILVLAGALASGLSTRTYDSVVLKTFGATRTQLVWAFVYEYALLGLVTATFSIAIGSLAAWAIITFIMEMSWHFSFVTALATAIIAMTLTIAAGFLTTWRALTAKPARILRTE